MTAGFFGLVVYLIEHCRSQGNSMPAPPADAPQDCNGAPDARPFDEINNTLSQSAEAASSAIDMTGNAGFMP